MRWRRRRAAAVRVEWNGERSPPSFKTRPRRSPASARRESDQELLLSISGVSHDRKPLFAINLERAGGARHIPANALIRKRFVPRSVFVGSLVYSRLLSFDLLKLMREYRSLPPDAARRLLDSMNSVENRTIAKRPSRTIAPSSLGRSLRRCGC
ncbi:hypothetical protein EVAR_37331_1 [Eumeta japonica]|uniref:Uncharacterized protein n=1 Tax=Eumeta variegata TaxID=151549 RepID=A0A4C1WXH7_EUMVA|nr:hypothetical protein EVAR_37331_1 [Eumeta japonica]